MLSRSHEGLDESFLLENPSVDNLEALEGGTLFPQELGMGRHRARRNPADVGMVASIGDEEDWLLHVRVEHRGDHGQVG